MSFRLVVVRRSPMFISGDEPGRRSAAKVLTKDEARRIATGLSQGWVAYNCRIGGDGDASIDAASAGGWLVCSRPMTAKLKISPRISGTSVALGLATAIVVLSVVPPALRPETGLPKRSWAFRTLLGNWRCIRFRL